MKKKIKSRKGNKSLKRIFVLVLILVMVLLAVASVMSAEGAGCEGSLLEVVMCMTGEDGGDVYPVRVAGQGFEVECTHGEDWVRVLDGEGFDLPVGWVVFVNKCGEVWLIPLGDPAVYPGSRAVSSAMRRSRGGDYPSDWKVIAYQVKEEAGWRCAKGVGLGMGRGMC